VAPAVGSSLGVRYRFRRPRVLEAPGCMLLFSAPRKDSYSQQRPRYLPSELPEPVFIRT
jgi:hypothetical protein